MTDTATDPHRTADLIQAVVAVVERHFGLAATDCAQDVRRLLEASLPRGPGRKLGLDEAVTILARGDVRHGIGDGKVKQVIVPVALQAVLDAAYEAALAPVETVVDDTPGLDWELSAETKAHLDALDRAARTPAPGVVFCGRGDA